MKGILKKRLEIIAFLLSVGFLTITLYTRTLSDESGAIRIFCRALQAADIVSLYFVFRKLWKTKWKKKIITSMQKVFSKIVKKWMEIKNKWDAFREKDKKILSGKTTVSFDFYKDDSQKSHKKVIKWKNLKSDMERLGYLYKHTVEYNVKHGLLASSSDTPTEIKMKKDYETHENQIFDLYITNRYKDSLKVDGYMIDELKKQLKK